MHLFRRLEEAIAPLRPPRGSAAGTQSRQRRSSRRRRRRAEGVGCGEGCPLPAKIFLLLIWEFYILVHSVAKLKLYVASNDFPMLVFAERTREVAERRRRRRNFKLLKITGAGTEFRRVPAYFHN